MNGFYVGDIIGNSYTHENEKYNLKTKGFSLFTKRSKFSDDTILSFATIDWLLNTKHTSEEMLEIIKAYYKRFPDKTPTIYGPAFANWVEDGCKEYRKSYGNGGAMRCSPIGWYANSLEEIDDLIEQGISPTHNTDSGKFGAKIVCYTIFLLKNGNSLEYVKNFLSEKFSLDLEQNIDEYRNAYTYTADSVETVRPALISLLNSKSYEDSIRNAVSFGGDTDTITTICSAISEAYYKKIPKKIVNKAQTILPKEFLALLNVFNLVLDERNLECCVM